MLSKGRRTLHRIWIKLYHVCLYIYIYTFFWFAKFTGSREEKGGGFSFSGEQRAENTKLIFELNSSVINSIKYKEWREDRARCLKGLKEIAAALLFVLLLMETLNVDSSPMAGYRRSFHCSSFMSRKESMVSFCRYHACSPIRYNLI